MVIGDEREKMFELTWNYFEFYYERSNLNKKNLGEIPLTIFQVKIVREQNTFINITQYVEDILTRFWWC